MLESFLHGGKLLHWQSAFSLWNEDLLQPQLFLAASTNRIPYKMLIFRSYSLTVFLIRPRLQAGKLEMLYRKWFSAEEDDRFVEEAMKEARRGIVTEEVLEQFFCDELPLKDDIDDKKTAFDIVMLELTEKGLLYPVPEPPLLYGTADVWYYNPFMVEPEPVPEDTYNLNLSSCSKKIGVEIRKVPVFLQNGVENKTNPFQLSHYEGSCFLFYLCGQKIEDVWLVLQGVVESTEIIFSEGESG